MLRVRTAADVERFVESMTYEHRDPYKVRSAWQVIRSKRGHCAEAWLAVSLLFEQLGVLPWGLYLEFSNTTDGIVRHLTHIRDENGYIGLGKSRTEALGGVAGPYFYVEDLVAYYRSRKEREGYTFRHWELVDLTPTRADWRYAPQPFEHVTDFANPDCQNKFTGHMKVRHRLG
ncbi:MAG TPA: hypothetical protein VJH97_01325 [Candidatus Nanoarchaeia archaeon]|nr:hypothetical protein [Candidatus Nanoarchaeia archaeon]